MSVVLGRTPQLKEPLYEQEDGWFAMEVPKRRQSVRRANVIVASLTWLRKTDLDQVRSCDSKRVT